ncbi:MAG: hypothetical protein WDZ60_02660 [Wenzhouxiangellaceae bacterium]
MRISADVALRRFRILRALIAAASMLAIVSCATGPVPRPAPEPGPGPADPVPTDSQPETPESSEPAPVPAKAPDPKPPRPEAPPADAPETAATPTASESEVDAVVPAPAEPAGRAAPASPPPATVSLNGRVVLDISRVDDVDDDSAADTVVYFKPQGARVSVSPREFEITTLRKRLIPDVLVVPVGSTVAFPNQDDILHNVFSVSSAANFDLGLYGEGESKSHTFREPGLAVIHCNVHHAMRADVLVVDTPFFARAGADGGFTIDGIAPAAGELVAWHPRAGFVRRQIRLPLTEPLEIELTLTRPRIPDHLDKTGQPYRPERPSRR